MKKIVVMLLCVISVALSAQPKRLYIDPDTRWISIHDPNGGGAKSELSLHLAQRCAAVVTVNERKTADYSVLIDRTGNSAGAATIYDATGTAVESFKPGHTATLKKVADRVCDFIRARP